MNKIFLSILFFFYLPLTYINCDLGSSPDENSNDSTRVLNKPIFAVWLEADSGSHGAIVNDTNVIDTTKYRANDTSKYLYLEGCALGNPVPAINEVLIDDQKITNLEVGYEEVIWFVGEMDYESPMGLKKVSIISDKGSCTGSITVPAQPCKITSHTAGQIVPLTSSITFTWEGDAQYYSIYYSLDLFYMDTNSNNEVILFFTNDTVLTQKTVTIPLNNIDTNNLESGSIFFTVINFNGVAIKPGATANMEGTADGFLIGSNGLGRLNRVSLNFAMPKSSTHKKRVLSDIELQKNKISKSSREKRLKLFVDFLAEQ